jgi:hypothetical protein
MILSITMPADVQIFTQTPELSENGCCIILRSCPRLRAEIESKWRGIIDVHPMLRSSEEGMKILVRDLFNELQANPDHQFIKEFWGSFLLSIAMKLVSKIYRNTTLDCDAIQFACMSSITNIHEFFNKLDLSHSSNENLLPVLKAYTYAKIKNHVYSCLSGELSNSRLLI